MEPIRQITRILHQEHLSTLSVLNRLDGLLGEMGPKKPPDRARAGLTPLLNDLAAIVDGEVGPHFAFEEEALFPRLAEYGDSGIGTFLSEEHDAILPLGARLGALARGAAKDGFSGDDWAEFHRGGLELVERLMSHIQKEEMGLLPVLDDMLDEKDDRELANAYLMTR
jgi:hemerythrin-like domain-containing protein